MIVVDAIVAAIKFISANFGTEILVISGNKLTGWAKRLFASSNVLIFGAKATGKSCLVNFMMTGKPYTVSQDGDKVTPAPTGMGAILDSKITLHQNDWHKLKMDFPGDPELRHTWKRGIEDFDPNGIVYMMNGQHMVIDAVINQKAVETVVTEMFTDVLSFYSTNLRNLKAVCICINFCDLWSHNSTGENRLVRAVRDAIERQQDANHIFQPLNFSVHATQLWSGSKNWNETKQAIAHLGADLMRKAH